MAVEYLDSQVLEAIEGIGKHIPKTRADVVDRMTIISGCDITDADREISEYQGGAIRDYY